MDQFFENSFSRLKELPKEFIFPLIISFLGLILIVYGLIQYFGNNTAKSSELNLEEITITQPVKSVKKIEVDVEGAVVNKGVYSLEQDARVKDALIAAGGLSGKADRDFVEKHINLAGKISDGAKIYVPRIGESILDGVQTTQDSSTSQSSQININTASATELDQLPGVGLVTAQKIIDGRPYSDVSELLSKKIVGQKVYDEIKTLVVVF